VSLTPDQAFGIVMTDIRPIASVEAAELLGLCGRIAAAAPSALRSLPAFDVSAVDGYAVGNPINEDELPLRLSLGRRVAAGDPGHEQLAAGSAVPLATGAAVPGGVAAVVMREHCREEGGQVLVGSAVARGANIRRRGEDVAIGDALFGSGTILDARHIALLAAAGHTSLSIFSRLRVGVVSTGNELRPPGAVVEAQHIYDANGPMLAAFLAAPWVELVDGGIVPDDRSALAARLRLLLAQCDFILLSGGAAGSDTDHSAEAIKEVCGDVKMLRIAQRPGKPMLLGSAEGVPILGLPGNTTAALVDFLLYARPMLLARAGARPQRPQAEPGVALSPIPHAPQRTDFVPVRIAGRSETGLPLLEPLARAGHAQLRPFVLADGIAELPAGLGDVLPGAPLVYHPFAAPFALRS
jgi:molybdopterin molybdotransferase